VLRRLRTLWRRRAIESELDAELRDHIDRETELYITRGVPPHEARRRALVAFGGLEQTKEACREARGFTLLESLLQDVRFGTRLFARHPGFTTVAVFSLALGIGANTALFSVVDAAVLKTLPVRDPHELVALTAVMRSGNWFSNLDPEIWDEIRNARSFQGIFASWRRRSNLRTSRGDIERVSVSMVTGHYYDTLGVQALLGRTISASDEQDAPRRLVVVLSYAYWRRQFEADPDVLGRTVFLDATPATVIGIEPPGFFGMDRGSPPDLTIPMQRSEVSGVWVVGRLAAGVARGTALAEANAAMARALARIRPRIETWHPTEREAWLSMRAGFAAADKAGEAATFTEHARLLVVLMLMSGTILLIGCANVSNLLMARTWARGEEISLRLAIGASRGRVIRQLLTESALLGALSGVLGIAFAFWARRLLLAWFMGEEPSASIDAPLDHRVLAFTAALAAAVVLVSGLAPALRATRVDMMSTFKPGANRSFGLRLSAHRALLVVQVAASLALMVGAGLFSRTLANLRHVDPGFEAENVLLMTVDTASRSTDPAVVVPLLETILQRIGQTPGVQSVAVGANVVFGRGRS
jgi:predicted permease